MPNDVIVQMLQALQQSPVGAEDRMPFVNENLKMGDPANPADAYASYKKQFGLSPDDARNAVYNWLLKDKALDGTDKPGEPGMTKDQLNNMIMS